MTVVKAFEIPVEDLVLIEDKTHPLYDPRVEWPADPALVADLIARGWTHGALEVAESGEEGKFVVLDGRRRVKAVREANRKRAEPIVPVAFVTAPESGSQQFLALWGANAHRVNDPPLLEAQKIARFLELARGDGGTRDEALRTAALVLGVSRDTIRNRLRILTAAPEVRQALQEDRITASDAVRLSTLKDPAEQVKRLSLIQPRPEVDESEPAKKKRRKGKRGTQERPTRRRIAHVLEQLGEDHYAAPILGWVLGTTGNRAFAKAVSLKEGEVA